MLSKVWETSYIKTVGVGDETLFILLRPELFHDMHF